LRNLLTALVTLGALPAAAAADPGAGESTPAPAGVYVHDILEAVPPEGTEISRLEVDNRLGDVRIVGHDGPGLSISAVKHAPDETTLERLEVKMVQDPSGPVSIRTQLAPSREARPIPAGSARIDLVVRVPRKARVAAAVWNGRLRVRGVDNGAEVRANEGEIAVAQASGSIVADIAAGPQRFEEIYGELETRSLIGNVDLHLIRGQRLATSVQRGDVRARQVRVKHMVIRVIRGDIRVEAEMMAGGHYAVASYRGDVHARVRGGRHAQVVARAGGGIEVPERLRRRLSSANEVVGYLGSGRLPAHIELRAVGGNVILAEF
jgi:hypothetical protein